MNSLTGGDYAGILSKPIKNGRKGGMTCANSRTTMVKV